eukprot:tig00020675_g12647.t1
MTIDGTQIHVAVAAFDDVSVLLSAMLAAPQACAALAQQDRTGSTPLHIACRLGRVEVARALLAAGAPAGQDAPRDRQGLLPGEVGPERARRLVHHWLEGETNPETGAAATACERSDDAVLADQILKGHLILAAEKSDEPAVRDLLNAADRDGAIDIDATDLEGRTALLAACEAGAPNIVLLLLQHGADPARWASKGPRPIFQLLGLVPARPPFDYHAVVGTGFPRYRVTWQPDYVENIDTQIQSITAMPEYAGKSNEEIRWDDYRMVSSGKKKWTSTVPEPTALPATSTPDAARSALDLDSSRNVNIGHGAFEAPVGSARNVDWRTYAKSLGLALDGLRSRGVKLDGTPDEHGCTVFHYAAVQNAALTIEDILGACKDPRAALSVTDPLGRTPLALACWKGNFAAAAALLPLSDPRAQDFDGNCCLHLTGFGADGGADFVIKVLHRCPKLARMQNLEGETPLHRFAEQQPWLSTSTSCPPAGNSDTFVGWKKYMYTGAIERAAHVLTSASDVAVLDASGRNPIHVAVAAFDNVSVLLSAMLAAPQACAALAQQDRTGSTPLHIACRLGRVEVARALLAAGAPAGQDAPRDRQGLLPGEVGPERARRLVHRWLEGETNPEANDSSILPILSAFEVLAVTHL